MLLAYVGLSVVALYWVRPLTPQDSLRLMVIMTPVRLAAIGWFWLAARREGFASRVGFEGGLPRALGHATLMLGLWALFLTESSGGAWPWPQRLLGIAVCLTVGLFEELAFRGVVLELLLRRLPPRGAALASAVAFTLYHCRPQSLPAWPHVFLTGVVFANLRLRGLGIGWLAVIHGAVDASFFFAGDRGVQDYGPARTAFLTGLFLYAVFTVPPEMKSRAALEPARPLA